MRVEGPRLLILDTPLLLYDHSLTYCYCYKAEKLLS